MFTESRRDREKKQLKRLILSHAASIIAREGLSGFTIRKLASSIDYSPRTVYLYFKDKNTILAALVDDAYASTASSLQSDPPSNRTEALQRITFNIKQHITSALAQPEHYRVVVDLLNREEFTPGPNQALVEHVVKQDIATAVTEHSPERVESTSELLFATVRGIAMHVVSKRHTLDENAIERIIEMYTTWIVQSIAQMMPDHHGYKENTE